VTATHGEKVASELRVARWVMVGQSGITGCSGLIAAFTAAIVGFAAGIRWLLLAVGLFVGGALLMAFAVALWKLRSRLGPRWDRWKWTALAVEAGLVPAGLILLAFPQSTATQGPFADGGEGAIGLTGFAYAGGLVIVALVAIHAARIAILRALRGVRTEQ
jgi:hypothetical protein